MIKYFFYCCSIIIFIAVQCTNQLQYELSNDPLNIEKDKLFNSEQYKNTFVLSIDDNQYFKWGCHYPVTYIFSVGDSLKRCKVQYKSN